MLDDVVVDQGKFTTKQMSDFLDKSDVKEMFRIVRSTITVLIMISPFSILFVIVSLLTPRTCTLLECCTNHKQMVKFRQVDHPQKLQPLQQK